MKRLLLAAAALSVLAPAASYAQPTDAEREARRAERRAERQERRAERQEQGRGDGMGAMIRRWEDRAAEGGERREEREERREERQDRREGRQERREDRRDEWQERREEWRGERRDDRREWRQDRREDRREWREDRREWRQDRREARRWQYRGRWYPSYRVEPYYWAPGFSFQYWSSGQYLPRQLWSRNYVIYDAWRYGLPQPAYGYVWVRVYEDAYLVHARSGRIVDVIRDVFYW